ncbi:MAG: CGNR zinc finger domain-containing protein [Candidatus Binataceae bacterium]|nr:CGNR zinc finger domain-containing protein [Candidatus Binataceae bacterium]
MRNRDAQRFRFVGFYRCLDFINTAPTRGAERTERIRNFADLVTWLHEAGLLGTAEARNAIDRWDGTGEGDHARARAIGFRDRLQEMAEDIAASNPVSNAAIAAINEDLRTRSGYVEIFRSEGGLAERFRHEPRRATQLIAPLAESAASLLCHGTLSLVRRCANPACGLFFYDTSKTHRRRWCDMRICGNLMKVRAFHSRQRESRRAAVRCSLN